MEDYQVDLKRKNLVHVKLQPDGNNYLAITPSFISEYTSTLSNSLVYLGACDSTYNDTLTQAFLSKGAGAVVGYSRLVSSDFADRHGRAMFEAMVADRTTSEIPGIDVDRDRNRALFDLATGSDTDLTINIGLRNGHFEIGHLSGWEAVGDARAISSLGPLLPTQKEQMAFISTADSNSAISQSFFVPAKAKKLLFNYNLVSEEPMEYFNSQYNDQFDVLLRPDPLTAKANSGSATVFSASIKTSRWFPISKIDFPDGDNTTFHTKFKQVSYDLKAWRGQRVNLSFEVFDRGDAIYDTAALIDNIQITM